jgi:iron(III) transport system ATP-binding protein
VSPEPILCLHQITRQFSPHIPPAIDSLSLALQPGELLALLGSSGCGKTTLLRLIAGFESPQSGTITIAQQLVAGAGYWVAPERRQVGMVFQDYALFPHLTVWQNVEFGLSHKKPVVTASRVKAAIALVGLEGLEHRYPHQLSGGQQQRVALARAVTPNPFLILLDEPLSNLDIQVRLRLRQELRSILKAAEASAIFVTHDQEEALSIADQVAVMHSGRLEQTGTPEQLYQEPTSRFVGEFVLQANFLAAQRQQQLWHTEIGTFPVAQTRFTSDTSPHTLPSTVDLMVRQEDLHLQPDSTSRVIIADRQFLGREYRYSLRTPTGLELIARSTQVWPRDISVRVAIAAQSLQSFASVSG